MVGGQGLGQLDWINWRLCPQLCVAAVFDSSAAALWWQAAWLVASPERCDGVMDYLLSE